MVLKKQTELEQKIERMQDLKKLSEALTTRMLEQLISDINIQLELICPRIFVSHASPPVSSLLSNQTSTPAVHNATAMRSTTSTSCDA